MYASTVAESGDVIIGVYRGVDLDADHARAVSSIAAADSSAVEQGLPLVCILVTHWDTTSPPPVWRKRMAEANQNMRAKEYWFALVSPNPLIRGVLTAINWLSAVPSHHHYIAVASFHEAATWVRRETLRPYPMLEALHQRVLKEMSPAA